MSGENGASAGKAWVIGKRAFVEKPWDYVLMGGAGGGVLLLVVVLMLILDSEMFLEMWGICLFLILTALGLGSIGFLSRPKILNNRSKEPTIIVENGFVVLIHYNGKRELLSDKIVSFYGERYWRITGRTRSGNIVTTHREQTYYGDIVFTLEKDDGLRYTKKVKFVDHCLETADYMLKNLFMILAIDRGDFTDPAKQNAQAPAQNDDNSGLPEGWTIKK